MNKLFFVQYDPCHKKIYQSLIDFLYIPKRKINSLKSWFCRRNIIKVQTKVNNGIL